MSIKIRENKLYNNLVDVAYNLARILAKEEDFHPSYLKNKDAFRNLMRTERELESEFKKYQTDLVDNRLDNYINWYAYAREKVSASITDIVDVKMNGEIINVRILLTKSLIYALVAGGNSTEDEIGYSVGWSPSSSPALDFLDKYSLKLARDITKTTSNRVKKSIQISLKNGEDIGQATARVSKVIKDPVRAKMIAHTESVRAYSEGRIEVGKKAGATHKSWDATLNRCPICDSLDGKEVRIDGKFKAFNGRTYTMPPAHPRCRCLVRLMFKK